MKYEVILTDLAKQDLREIAFYVANISCDTGVARKFIEKLMEKCLDLDLFPNAGALPKDRVLKSRGFRFVSYKNYLIFYLVDEENKVVYVVSVFNSRRDYMRVIKRIK